MEFLYKATTMLNQLYRISGYCYLLYSIFSLCVLLRYQVPNDTLTVFCCFVATATIFFTFEEGRKAFETRNHIHLKLFFFMFAFYFCVPWFGQGQALDLMRHNTANRTNSVARVEIISRFDEQSTEIQQFIQTTQQEHRCCGIFGWTDYEKEIGELPVSCCHKLQAHHRPGVDQMRDFLAARERRTANTTISTDQATRCIPDDLKDIDGCRKVAMFVDRLKSESGLGKSLLTMDYIFSLVLVVLLLVVQLLPILAMILATLIECAEY